MGIESDLGRTFSAERFDWCWPADAVPPRQRVFNYDQHRAAPGIQEKFALLESDHPGNPVKVGRRGYPVPNWSTDEQREVFLRVRRSGNGNRLIASHPLAVRAGFEVPAKLSRRRRPRQPREPTIIGRIGFPFAFALYALANVSAIVIGFVAPGQGLEPLAGFAIALPFLVIIAIAETIARLILDKRLSIEAP